MKRQAWLASVIIAVAALLVATTTGAATPAAAQEHTSADGHTHEHPPGPGRCVEQYRDRPVTGRSCETDRGTYKVRLSNGDEIETHGPDEVVVAAPGDTKGGGGGGKPPPKTSPSPSPSPSPTSSPTSSPSPAAAPPVCAPAGGDRSQLIYAFARDDSDRYSGSVDVVRSRFMYANDLLSREAAQLGAQISYKIACGAQGQPSVTPAPLDITKGAATFESIVNALVKLGHNDPYTDYWVFYDEYLGNGIGGQATLCRDDRLVADNCSMPRKPRTRSATGIGRSPTP